MTNDYDWEGYNGPDKPVRQKIRDHLAMAALTGLIARQEKPMCKEEEAFNEFLAPHLYEASKKARDLGMRLQWTVHVGEEVFGFSFDPKGYKETSWRAPKEVVKE